MGGAVDAVGDLVGGVGGVVSGVTNNIPVIGPYVGPVVGGITGGPLGFATSLAGNALQGSYGSSGGGGGGSSTPMYAQPNINYGNNTYSYGDSKVNASPYFITGDKGVYNLLPALGQINAGQNSMKYFPSSFGGNPTRATERFNSIGAKGAYTPYEAYQDIQAQMANDPKALAAFNKAYSPTTFNAPTMSLLGGYNLPIGQPNPTSPLGQFYANTPNPYGNQFVNFGLNSPIKNQPDLRFNELAKYAVENKNPFFLPFETTQGATPLAFTPSASALAPIDTASYLSGFGTANAAQQQFKRDQQIAAREAQRAQEAQRMAAREAQRIQRDAQRNADRVQNLADDDQDRNDGRSNNNRSNAGLLSSRTNSQSNTSKK